MQIPKVLPPAGDSAYPKSKRLRKKLDFKRVLDGGLKVVCSQLVVFGLPQEGANPRLGLIVSKKVGNAVARNRVKRQLREIFRGFAHEANWDLVIIARPRHKLGAFEDLAAAYRQCYSRLQKNWQHRTSSNS